MWKLWKSQKLRRMRSLPKGRMKILRISHFRLKLQSSVYGLPVSWCNNALELRNAIVEKLKIKFSLRSNVYFKTSNLVKWNWITKSSRIVKWCMFSLVSRSNIIQFAAFLSKQFHASNEYLHKLQVKKASTVLFTLQMSVTYWQKHQIALLLQR